MRLRTSSYGSLYGSILTLRILCGPKPINRKFNATALRLAGLTYTQIGKILGVSRQRAQRIVVQETKRRELKERRRRMLRTVFLKERL